MSYYTDTDGTIKLTRAENEMLRAAVDIKKTFITCPVQKIAYEALISDLLNCDFAWTTTIGKKSWSKKLDIDDYEHAMWTEFVRSLVQEFCLYGFAVYRLATVPREDPLENKEILHDDMVRAQASGRDPKRRRKEKKQRRFPEVANGQCIVLRWRKVTREWVPYSETGAAFSRKDGWRMVMPAPPVRWGTDDTPVYKSFSANSAGLSAAYLAIRTNIEKRDNINTEIGVYTQMVRNLTGGGNGLSTRPWFQPAVHGAMTATPGDLHQPFEMKVADRLEAAMGLANATETYRVYKEKPPIGADGRIQPPKEAPQRHEEHVITDGFEAREVTYRRAPEDLVRILDMLFNLILFTYSVMPQVIGKNINSERNAASNRIAEVSIDRYNEGVKHLRRFVQMCITEVSSEAVGDKDTLVKIKPCVTMHTLRTIEMILTTEAAREMYACVFDIPIEAIDATRLKKKQDVALEEPGVRGSRDKPTMTEEQKDASMKAKNEPE